MCGRRNSRARRMMQWTHVVAQCLRLDSVSVRHFQQVRDMQMQCLVADVKPFQCRLHLLMWYPLDHGGHHLRS